MPPEEPCQFLPWDTQFFGHRIARATGRLTPELVGSVLRWCVDNAIECMYFLADANDPQTVILAQRHGFGLMDIRVTLKCDTLEHYASGVTAVAPGLRVRPSCFDDLEPLQAIARTAHTDTRFYFDQCFSRASCAALYQTWIRQSCQGQAAVVLVAELEGRPKGYVSCELDGRAAAGRIGLVGVDAAVRGRGVGRALVDHALVWFAERPVQVVSVVTQGRNVAAQRMYQRGGFVTDRLQLWYHKWFSGCASSTL